MSVKFIMLHNFFNVKMYSNEPCDPVPKYFSVECAAASSSSLLNSSFCLFLFRLMSPKNVFVQMCSF